MTDKAFTLPCIGHLSQGDSKETSLCTNGGQNIQSRQRLHLCVKTCSEVTELGKAIYNRRNLSFLFGSFDQTLFKGEKQLLVKKRCRNCKADEKNWNNSASPPSERLIAAVAVHTKLGLQRRLPFVCQNILAPST